MSLEVLQLKTKSGDKKLTFRRLDSEELEQAYALRYDVYKGRGYLEKVWQEQHVKDHDDYDDLAGTVHFGAFLEDELVGYIRGIPGPNLPVADYFDLAESKKFAMYGKNAFELGRFVIKKPDNGDYLPRNIIFMFLVRQILMYCEEFGYEYSCAFITENLKTKMDQLKMPLQVMDSYVLRYPRDGKMAPYFYDREIFPVYFSAEEFGVYIKKIFRKFKLIKQTGEHTFKLRSNLYSFVLKVLKKL